MKKTFQGLGILLLLSSPVSAQGILGLFQGKKAAALQPVEYPGKKGILTYSCPEDTNPNPAYAYPVTSADTPGQWCQGTTTLGGGCKDELGGGTPDPSKNICVQCVASGTTYDLTTGACH